MDGCWMDDPRPALAAACSTTTPTSSDSKPIRIVPSVGDTLSVQFGNNRECLESYEGVVVDQARLSLKHKSSFLFDMHALLRSSYAVAYVTAATHPRNCTA